MIIYKSTNMVNGKVYIGLTTSKIEQRKRQHKCDALTRSSKQTIHKAIRKYGWNNFNWEIIDSANTFEELCEKEKYWISYYNSLNNGYNETLGGEGVLGVGKPLSDEHKKKISYALRGRPLSEETRKKMSKSMKGRILSEETKKRISEAKKGKSLKINTPKKPLSEEHKKNISKSIGGENHPFFGKSHSEESKKRMSESSKGMLTGVDSPHAKVVIQLTMDDEFVAGHGSIKDASVYVGGKSPNIVNVCKGVRKSAYGFKWMYGVEYSEV